MNKLARIIETLGPNELRLIQKDLITGNIERLIAEKLAQAHSTKTSVCPVCTTPTSKKTGLYLEFGPVDLRQRATFCAADCLTYFVQHTIKP